MHEQQTGYHGAPDLVLTATLVQLGGGPTNFVAARLLGALTGNARDAELQKLTNAIKDSLRVAQSQNVALP